MKFFDKIFGEKKAEEKKIEFVDCREIDSFINKRSKEKFHEAINEAREVVKSSIELIEKIKKNVLEMEGDVKIGPEVPPKIKKIILSDKPFFIKGVLNAVSSIEGELDTTGMDAEKIRAIGVRLTNIAKTIADIDLRYGRFLHLAVEMTAFRKELKSLVKNISDLNLKISKLPTQDKFEELKNKISYFDSEVKREKELREKLIAEKEKQKFAEMRYSEFLESKEFEDFKNLEEEYDKIIKNKNNISSAVYERISSLSRILRKIKKFNKEDSKITEIIDFYIENPAVFFERDSKEINLILSKSKNIPLDEDEKSKILKFNEGFPELEKMKSDYIRIKESEKEISSKKEHSPILRKKQEMEYAINKLNENIIQIEKEINRIVNKKAKIISEIEELKEKIEKDYNDEIKINIDSIKQAS